MDGQPDIVSFEPRPRRRNWWPKASRGGQIAIVVILLACLGVIASLALLVADRDHTITDLRAALRKARHQAPATAAGPALPVDSGSAMFTLPDAALGSFSVVAVPVRPGPARPRLPGCSCTVSMPVLASATACSRAPAAANTSPRLTWRMVPRTGAVTSRSPRRNSPSARRLLASGSCCTDGRTARPLAASRVR